MKRLISLILVSVLVGGLLVVGVAKNGSDQAKVDVSYELSNHIALNIESGKTVPFGEIDPTSGKVKKNNATILSVESNTKWEIGQTMSVIDKPDNADDDAVLNTLSVKVKPSQGNGDKNGIKVDYTLDNFDNLPAGSYGIEVTFTATISPLIGS